MRHVWGISITLALALIASAPGCKPELLRPTDALLSGTTATPSPSATSLTVIEDTPTAATLSTSNATSYEIVTLPAKGSISLTASTGAYTYTPTLNLNGSDSFTFRAANGAVTSSPATVSVTITPVDDAPVGAANTVSIVEDSSANAVPLNYTDVESDTAVTCSVTSVTGGTAGTCTCTNGVCSTTFTPTVGAKGTASANLTYTVTATTLQSEAKTVSFDIAGYCAVNTGATLYTAYGAGTAASPHKICTLAQIQNLQANTAAWSKVFLQKTDIDATGYSSVIGTAATKFTGTYDGGSNKITNFTINTPGSDSVGFFGDVNGDGGTDGIGDGVIQNLRVETDGVTGVVGQRYVGIIAGMARGSSKIKNCTTSGKVTGSGGSADGTGGILGANDSSGGTVRVQNCSSNATVSGRINVGGLYGGIGTTIVENGAFSGTVTASSTGAGGIVGGATSVDASSFTGTITGLDYVGGICGASCTVTNSTSSGTVTGTSQFVGGIAGSSNLISNSVSSGPISGVTRVGGIVGTCGGTVARVWSSSRISNPTGNFSGGICGNNGGPTTISDCVSTGDIIGGTGVHHGGIIGQNAATITRCISLSRVVHGNSYGGGIAGSVISGGAIIDSAAFGAVIGPATANNGGLAGDVVSGGQITRSFAAGNVYGAQNLGGLSGNLSGVITDSFATGNIIGVAYYGGGLVGSITAGGTVTRSYATGDIQGFAGGHSHGGLAGSAVNATITHSFSTGQVSVGAPIGGFVGANTTSTFLANAWNNSGGNAGLTDTGGGNVANIDPYPYSTLLTQATYTALGWDFVGEGANGANDYWVMPRGADGIGPPRLVNSTSAWTRYPCYGSGLTNAPFAAGSGTAVDPNVICTAAQLKAIAADTSRLGKTYLLAETVDLTSIPWTPIGGTSAPFTGTFEGMSNSITGIAYSTSGSNAGIFGSISGDGVYDTTGDGEVRNLRVNLSPTNGITGAASTGIVAGSLGTGRILGTRVSGGNSVGTSQVGGLVGQVAAGGLVRDSGSTAAVSGSSDSVGGLVGANAGTVETSRAMTGAVSGSTNSGGIAGSNTGTIRDSYAQGAVTATLRAGGLVGVTSGTIDRCYSTNVPTSTSNGGLIAQKTSGSVTDSFWNVTTSGVGTDGSTAGSDGGTGKNTANMQTQATFTNFDFNKSWRMPTADTPRLRWE